jgi:large repetitive protein
MRISLVAGCGAAVLCSILAHSHAGAALRHPRAHAGRPSVNWAPGWLSKRARTSKQLVYVADGFSNKVVVYPAGDPYPSPIGEISFGVSEPEGMWVDGDGDLFVANTGNNTVEAFRHNHTTPYLIISQSYPGHDFGSTSNVILDAYSNVWVAGLDGTVTEYAYGTSNAVETLTSGLSMPIGMTFDRKGYLYVTNITPFGYSNVNQYAPGWVTGNILPLVYGASRIGGMLFDKAQNIYIADPINNLIQIYAKGSNTPTSRISSGLARPVFIAFDKNDNLYVQNYFANNVTAYAYGGTEPIATIANGLSSSYGVAVWSNRY